MDDYQLDKNVWTESDFGVMGWHDVTVWSMLTDPDKFTFSLDIDYIFNWVHPAPGETYFKFWIAPSVMVFENAWAVQIDIDSQQGGITIDHLRQEAIGHTPDGTLTRYKYTLECHEGSIELEATGFRMHVRGSPRLVERQSLDLAARGGVNFEC